MVVVGSLVVTSPRKEVTLEYVDVCDGGNTACLLDDSFCLHRHRVPFLGLFFCLNFFEILQNIHHHQCHVMSCRW
jgi:hypothetical protein